MAKLTKTRARKPIAESFLSLMSHGSIHQPEGEPEFHAFSLGVASEHTDGGLIRHELIIDRAEAERVRDWLTRALECKAGDGLSQTMSFSKSGRV